MAYRGTILGVPLIRIIIYWGLCWGPPILGNYHVGLRIHSSGFRAFTSSCSGHSEAHRALS